MRLPCVSLQVSLSNVRLIRFARVKSACSSVKYSKSNCAWGARGKNVSRVGIVYVYALWNMREACFVTTKYSTKECLSECVQEVFFPLQIISYTIYIPAASLARLYFRISRAVYNRTCVYTSSTPTSANYRDFYIELSWERSPAATANFSHPLREQPNIWKIRNSDVPTTRRGKRYRGKTIRGDEFRMRHLILARTYTDAHAISQDLRP